MDTSSFPAPASPISMASPLPPPAYSTHIPSDQLWKIKNAKYQSTLVKKGKPSSEDFRDHLRYIRDPHFTSAYGPGHTAPTNELPRHIKIQYSQVFCRLTELLDKFQDCISEIGPLQEEDLLFLLLRRFADSSDATVYAEIRRSEDVQIYDSTIEEPLVRQSEHLDRNSFDIKLQESITLESSLSHDTSVIYADLSMNYSDLQEELRLDETAYTLLPQTPSEVDATFAVTVNFPESISIEPPDSLRLCQDSPPEYSSSADWTDIWPEHDWNQLPFKFQPPSFRIHRCHHRGVERGGEDDAFELPLGFPEILHHMDETCNDVSNATFRIHNRSRQSLPLEEEGTQSFECDLFATIPSLYITVQREGDFLVYKCFRDRKEWISCHIGHEECSGC